MNETAERVTNRDHAEAPAPSSFISTGYREQALGDVVDSKAQAQLVPVFPRRDAQTLGTPVFQVRQPAEILRPPQAGMLVENRTPPGTSLRKCANTSTTSHQSRHSRASAGSRAAGRTGLWKWPPEVAAELGLRRRFARPGRRRPGMASWVRFVKIGRPDFAVFAVLPRNYQRARRRVRQKSWVPGDPASQKTAKTPAVPPLFFAVFAPENSDNRENRINAITKHLRAVAHQLTDLEYHAIAHLSIK